MDDLKIVLYIIIAIIWVVYNNYKKISEAGKKRDPSKPIGEVIPENWPGGPAKTAGKTLETLKEVVDKQKTKSERPAIQRPPLARRKPLYTRRSAASEPAISFVSEGGSTKPSQLVQFEEHAVDYDEPNPIIRAVRNMDLRQGIVMAEILKRPYN